MSSAAASPTSVNTANVLSPSTLTAVAHANRDDIAAADGVGSFLLWLPIRAGALAYKRWGLPAAVAAAAAGVIGAVTFPLISFGVIFIGVTVWAFSRRQT